MSDHRADLVLHAPVWTTDAAVGRLEHVIVDPGHGRVSHVVVRETALPNTLRLVPEKYLGPAGPEGLRLTVAAKRFAAFPEYLVTEYFSPDFFAGLADRERVKLPLAPSGWTVERPATPEGFVALVGHEAVFATDGRIGRVDGVLLDRATGRVSHLLLREGHLFGRREVQVPAGLIARYEAEAVHLSVTKAAVDALPDLQAA